MQVAKILETMDYGPAPESGTIAKNWLAERSPFGQFINGQFVAGSGHFDSINPATGKPIAKIAQATKEQVDQAVDAARAAFGSWSKLPGHARARYLYAIARQIQKHSRLLSVLETMDNGKPIRETRDIDIPLVARHFAYHAGWAQLMETEFPGYEPLGVAGQIIPWNFPLLMLAWKVAPALALGNTVVLKPAEFTSLTALAFAEICQTIGLPPGIVNIITGDGKVGALITEHPGIDKIAFTGSTEVGRIIRKATAGSGKKLSLELGGKSPFLVFDDADLDSVVEGVVDAIWFNQGEVCCAGSRIIVQENVAETLVKKLRARMEKLRMGDPLDKAVDMGAIIDPIQLQKIRGLVEQGAKEGGTVYQPSWQCPTDGCFYPPTLITNVAPASTVAQEEIFGPVAVLMTFRTPSEAVALANNTRYGLAASIWGENFDPALDIARSVKAGTVWINSTNMFDAASGFGGYRESGYGREGGREGLFEYMKRKKSATVLPAFVNPPSANGHIVPPSAEVLPRLDRTPKQFINGKQARPDSGYSLTVKNPAGIAIGEVGDGNRKDLRNAVEAARSAEKWADATAYNRAQILYYLAENLSARADEFAARISQQTGAEATHARAEVEASIERLFTYGAWADKYDGLVHATPVRNFNVALNEPIGVIGVVCPDEAPLLGLVACLAPTIAVGNTVILIPSERFPLSATDFYQVMETSDVPAGVVNIVTGKRDVFAQVLAEHDNVDAIWYFAGEKDSAQVQKIEAASITNMKRVWIGHTEDWATLNRENNAEFLRQATQVKNIWTPYFQYPR
jgi:aldehyde dehydrogenase (NAD+)